MKIANIWEIIRQRLKGEQVSLISRELHYGSFRRCMKGEFWGQILQARWLGALLAPSRPAACGSPQHLWQDTTGLFLWFFNLQPLNHCQIYSVPNTSTLQGNCFMLRLVSGQIMPKCPGSAPVGDKTAGKILVGKAPVYTPKWTSWTCCGSAHNRISSGDKHESIFCSHRYQQEHELLWSLSEGFFFSFQL